MRPFVANTDPEWFDELSLRSAAGQIDEAAFWSPRALKPLRKDLAPGEPIFLRLRYPHQAIAGVGFFAHFRKLRVDLAWEVFGWKVGAGSRIHFLERISRLRGGSPLDLLRDPPEIGFTVMRGLSLWPDARWMPWGTAEGWKIRTQRGALETEVPRVARLLDRLEGEVSDVAPELVEPFAPLDVDDRRIAAADSVVREGQGAFRLRLLDAYGGCAITGEATEPVLEAAHIQPYLGPRSNHPANGLFLTREWHTLFDCGYATVTSTIA